MAPLQPPQQSPVIFACIQRTLCAPVARYPGIVKDFDPEKLWKSKAPTPEIDAILTREPVIGSPSRAAAVLVGMKGDNDDETTGIAIIARAIEEPLRQIIANSGGEGAIIVQKVREGKDDFGYNARTDKFEKLYAAGVIDPTKVTRIAVENAASIASMLLTTECVIADQPEEANPAAAMGGMGGGMPGMM